jgi:ribonuclease Y
MQLITILASITSFLVGGGIIFIIYKKKEGNVKRTKKLKADLIIEKAKKDANEIKYNARKESKEIIVEGREQLERESRRKHQEAKQFERRLEKKEIELESYEAEKKRALQRLKDKEGEASDMKDSMERRVQGCKKKESLLSEKLSEIAEMTKEQAKKSLIETMKEQANVDFSREYRKMEEENRENSEKKAKRIIGIAIQRFAGEYVGERTISSLDLPGDELKGRLIGRDGRNIRAFEQICGVDLIIDDTPEIVVISSFNVVRREIARLALSKLIQDGRIHPAKIEEFHDKSKKEVDQQVLDLGQKAQMEIGVHGIHPEILKLVGALNWRTSYTQNQYQHALEAAFICGAMAQELGFGVKQARRAALLHDIGKVIDASAEGSHAVVGADFAKKYGESPDIVHAIRAHHDDEKPESILAHLVSASDALSGARPGARKAMMESYVSRLTDIEAIVNTFAGVSKSYAISGGREVRVFVQNDLVSDEETVLLSRNIAKKIEEEMSYPGTIKITVLRETKAIGVAK